MAKPIIDSLTELADKIDPKGKSEVEPDYKDPNRSIEKALERIAENFSKGSGGGSSEYVSEEFTVAAGENVSSIINILSEHKDDGVVFENVESGEIYPYATTSTSGSGAGGGGTATSYRVLVRLSSGTGSMFQADSSKKISSTTAAYANKTFRIRAYKFE